MPEPIFTLSLHALPAGGYDVSFRCGADEDHTLCVGLFGARAAMLRHVNAAFHNWVPTDGYGQEMEQVYGRR